MTEEGMRPQRYQEGFSFTGRKNIRRSESGNARKIGQGSEADSGIVGVEGSADHDIGLPIQKIIIAFTPD